MTHYSWECAGIEAQILGHSDPFEPFGKERHGFHFGHQTDKGRLFDDVCELRANVTGPGLRIPLDAPK